MAELIAYGTTSSSQEITVVAGTPATVFLKTASGAIPFDAEALIEAKSADATPAYTLVGSLTARCPMQIIDGAGTWRITRRPAGTAYGVDKN